MKLATISIVALLLPLPAAAQSLSETHELVWHPAGKTPGATHRLRDKASCEQRPVANIWSKGRPMTTCIADTRVKPSPSLDAEGVEVSAR